jgi:toxin-antitoxin system PIN domain toxin
VIAVDTNILIYAHREEFPQHSAAHQRLIELAEGVSPWGIPVFCLGEFLRVTTHRKVLRPPSSIDQALAFVAALETAHTFRWLLPDDAYALSFQQVVAAAHATGNLAFDAQIAAICVRHGATLLTHDRDFARFAIQTSSL